MSTQELFSSCDKRRPTDPDSTGKLRLRDKTATLSIFGNKSKAFPTEFSLFNITFVISYADSEENRVLERTFNKRHELIECFLGSARVMGV